MNIYGYLAVAVLAFLAAWGIQGKRWEADVLKMQLDASSELSAAYQERDKKVGEAENQKEAVQNEFNAFKKSEGERNAAVGASVKRVHVRAACPSVSEASTSSSGTTGGTAELDPAYRQTLSDLRLGVEEQRRLLNVCRAELMNR